MFGAAWFGQPWFGWGPGSAPPPPPDALLFLDVAVRDVMHFEAVHTDVSAHFDDARIGEACLFLNVRVGRP